MRNLISVILLLISFSGSAQLSPNLSLEIMANDLSENLNRLSTGNDEIIILIYQSDRSKTLNEPLYFAELVFDSKNKFSRITTGIDKNYGFELLLVMLERDTDKPLEQIDPVIRAFHKELLKAHSQKDYNEIGKFLGDDDLLGIEKIKLPSAEKVRIRGRQKMDKYEYEVAFN